MVSPAHNGQRPTQETYIHIHMLYIKGRPWCFSLSCSAIEGTASQDPSPFFHCKLFSFLLLSSPFFLPPIHISFSLFLLFHFALHGFPLCSVFKLHHQCSHSLFISIRCTPARADFFLFFWLIGYFP